MQMLMIGKGAFYGPPLHFAKVRSHLAKAAGIPTTKMHITVAEEDDVAIEVPDLSAYDLVEENIYGEWDEVPSDPVLILLAHSDESGYILDEHLLPLATRLKELANIVHDTVAEEDVEQAQALYRAIDHLAGTFAMSFAEDLPVMFTLEEIPT